MVRRRWRSTAGVIDPSWGLYGLGAVALLLSTVHLLTEGEGFGTWLETLILVALSATIFYTGHELPDRTLSREGAVLALGYTVVFTFSFVLLATAIVSIWYLEHGRVNDWRFVVLFAGVLGAAVGSRVNIYAVEFEESYERNESLTKLLTVNQRVLRHNLRNELTIVQGHLENVEFTADAEASESIAIVRRHLDDLLETSQTSRRIVGIWELDADETFDVRSLLTERIEDLHADHPDVPVSMACDDVPAVRAHVALPRAIDEVLANAVEHNDPGVAIEIDCTRTADGVRIDVADTGCGISTEETDVLFQPGETALEHGEGLGLWLLYWTVRKSDGELSFRNREGGGAVVEILLPAAE